MKHIDALNDFLKNSVNLNQTRLDQLDGRVKAIVGYLKDDTTIGALYDGYVPQGSWAHRTIIRPVGDYDEFDADFLLQLQEKPDWQTDPSEYLRQLRAAFRRSSTYQDMVQKKTRCVRIDYANDCHIDVVPCLILSDGRQVIINSAENRFEGTNPQGFTDWMRDKDRLAGGKLRRVIRLVKYIRDSKNTFSCPSVILTTLLGGRVRLVDAAASYADLPTAFFTLFSDLNAWLQKFPNMPCIEDPSCPGTTFNHRWNDAKYENFRAKIAHYTAKIETAYNEPDAEKSLKAWQEIFGAEFGVDGLQKASLTLAESRAPGEEFIEEKGYRLVGGYQAQIECIVERKPGFRHGPIRGMGRVNKNRWLQFQLMTNVPRPFTLYWKVRNRGQVAMQAGQLRGELLLDGGNCRRREHTLYPGEHYVEAYVVKDGFVLARDRHEVVIA